jgi:hypothetical protein
VQGSRTAELVRYPPLADLQRDVETQAFNTDTASSAQAASGVPTFDVKVRSPALEPGELAGSVSE